MTSPSLVRFAVAASIATTGAAAYYFLSDGGNPEKLDERLRDTRAKLDTTVASARGWTSATAASIQKRGVENRETKESHAQDAVIQQVNGMQEESVSKGEIDRKERGAYCHTCSGPRIWFFADKLRLKRRFTPYPDPPRE